MSEIEIEKIINVKSLIKFGYDIFTYDFADKFSVNYIKNYTVKLNFSYLIVKNVKPEDVDEVTELIKVEIERLDGLWERYLEVEKFISYYNKRNLVRELR